MQAPLIAVAIATVIFTQLIGRSAQDDLHRARVKLGTAQGQQLDRLAQAVNNYSSKNHITLTSGVGSIVNANGVVAAVVDMYKPTMAELTAMGYLNSNFSATNYFGGGYAVNLGLTPTGCSYPNCAVNGTVYLSSAVLSRGLPDLTILGAATQAIGNTGGFSKQATPGTINGLSGGWSSANPAGNVAGILAEQVGNYAYDALYYRLDGASGLTAAFNAGGQILNNIKPIASGSACTGNSFGISDGTNGVAAGAVLSCQGGTFKSQGSAFWQDPVADAASLGACAAANAGQTKIVRAPSVGAGPRGYTCNGAGTWEALAVDDSGNLTVDGTLTANGNVALGNAAADTVTINGATTANSSLTIGNGTAASATNTLIVNRTAIETNACSPNGAVARDSVGLILSCQSGSWRKATGSGTGMRGVMSPHANKQLSCITTVDGGTGYAKVDSNGDVWVQFVSLYFAATNPGWNLANNNGATFSGKINSSSPAWYATVSVGVFGMNVVITGNGGGGCAAVWPAT